jgi:NAD(P)-dependent dehydrogenase (short-subunit alcohol dehydrogenase family)
MGQFKDKVALATGGASGIGRAVALAFAREGAAVVVAGRRDKQDQETVDLIKGTGDRGLFVRTDVTKEADVSEIVSVFGRLAVAFNSAGTEGSPKPVTEETQDNYDLVFSTNVKGTLLSMNHEIPAMLRNGAAPS